MKGRSLSGILTSGVGRRIFGFFLLAGVLPVVVTALLAYFEVTRGLEQDVSRQLREYSKSYGTDIVERLIRASEKADALIEDVESTDFQAIQGHDYLTSDFSAISVQTPGGGALQLFGEDRFLFDDGVVDRNHLQEGNSQLLVSDEFGTTSFYLLRGVKLGLPGEAIYAFELSPNKLWGLRENTPYQTDFCAYSTSGAVLNCTSDVQSDVVRTNIADHSLNSNYLMSWEVADGEAYVSAGWQLFTNGIFAYPAIDIIASQPKAYALRSGADFRRIFPPALALVVILVGALSLSLIGESLVPLQRLTIVARQIAAGHLSSRVRVRSDDEFGALGDAFNNMAERLDSRISTMKAMSDIDKMIMSGAYFEGVSEGLIDHLVDLTGV